jgi:hypothetical protein
MPSATRETIGPTRGASAHLRMIRAGALGGLLACAMAGPVRSETATLGTGAQELTIRYGDGRVTLTARNATVAEIVRAIGREAGFETDVAGDYDERLGLKVEGEPLVPLLQRLAGRHSMILLLRSPQDRMSRGPVEKLMIWSANGQAGNAPVSVERVRFAQRIVGESPDDGGAEPTSPEQRIAALRKVIRSGDKTSIELLERTVGGDSDENVRGFALRALAATGGQEAMLALGRILFGDPNPDTRLQALRALASSKSPVAQSFVDKAADDPDVMVRTAANEAITRWQ